MQILEFILALLIVIFVHELGHYISARIFKLNVVKFCICIDYKFSLVKVNIGDTVFSLGWLPLGGYVSFIKDEFRALKSWKKLIVNISGLVMNVLLCYVILVYLSLNKGNSFFDSIGIGVSRLYDVSQFFFNSLHEMFLHNTTNSAAISVKVSEPIKQIWNWTHFWIVTFSISFVAFIFNSLPIPSLDGGSAVLNVVEMITNKKLNTNLLDNLEFFGFIIFITCTVLYNLLYFLKLI